MREPNERKKIHNFNFDLNGGMDCGIEETPAPPAMPEDEALADGWKAPFQRQFCVSHLDMMGKDQRVAAATFKAGWEAALAALRSRPSAPAADIYSKSCPLLDEFIAGFRAALPSTPAARPSTQASRYCLGNDCPDFVCEECTEKRPSPQGEDADRDDDITEILDALDMAEKVGEETKYPTPWQYNTLQQVRRAVDATHRIRVRLLEVERARLSATADAGRHMREALDKGIWAWDQLMPPAPTHICGPEAGCDGACAEFAAWSEGRGVILKARAAIERSKEDHDAGKRE